MIIWIYTDQANSAELSQSRISSVPVFSSAKEANRQSKGLYSEVCLFLGSIPLVYEDYPYLPKGILAERFIVS